MPTDNEEDSIGSAHVHRSSGTRHKAGVSTADRILFIIGSFFCRVSNSIGQKYSE